MPAYLFQIELPVFTMEMMNMVPEHRQYINKLFIEGKILSYSVSMNRDMIWCVMTADSEQHAMEHVITFPLYPHFIDVTCTPLLFHNTVPSSMPGIFLN